jgi:hypothetical protein
MQAAQESEEIGGDGKVKSHTEARSKTETGGDVRNMGVRKMREWKMGEH